MYRMIVLLTLTAVVFTGCTQTTEPVSTEPPSYALVSSSTVSGYGVEIFADGPISVGYTPLHVKITRDGQIVRNAHVTIMPDMDMGMHHHSCPVEQPSTSGADAHGYYHGAAIFTMSSATAWTITIAFDDHNADTTTSVTTKIAVAAAEAVRTAKDSSSLKYVFAMQAPTQRMGMNDVIFHCYRTADGFDFVPVNDAVLTFEPSMPSMGHGSHGNQQPTRKGNGVYGGRVNYTMTGDWEIALSVSTSNGTSFKANYPVMVR